MALMIVLLPMIPQFTGGKNYNAPTLHGGKFPQMINCFSGGVGMKKKKTFLIIMKMCIRDRINSVRKPLMPDS